MKLLVNVGPDTLAVEYSSKQSCKKSISRALKSKKAKKLKKGNGLGINWQGRGYCYSELKDAVVMTKEEHWQAMKA